MQNVQNMSGLYAWLSVKYDLSNAGHWHIMIFVLLYVLGNILNNLIYHNVTGVLKDVYNILCYITNKYELPVKI